MHKSSTIEVRDVSAHYGPIRALDSVSMEFAAGETTAIIGPNGAGKSTLLNVVAGVHRPSGGVVLVDGKGRAGHGDNGAIRQEVGYSPEGRRIFPQMSVGENLLLGAHTASARDVKGRFDEVCEWLPVLRDRVDQEAGTLSGGQQQMLAIGRAMMRSPRALLLDEPTLGLSPRMVLETTELIRTLGERGLTIVLVEQNAHVALSLAKSAYVLESGQLVTGGLSEEVRMDQRVREAYLPETVRH